MYAIAITFVDNNRVYLKELYFEAGVRKWVNWEETSWF